MEILKMCTTPTLRMYRREEEAMKKYWNIENVNYYKNRMKVNEQADTMLCCHPHHIHLSTIS